MKESYGKGLASHADPESCGGVREDDRRSVDRGRRGLGIEPRKHHVRDADTASVLWKATPRPAANARPAAGPAGSETPCTRRNTSRGSREIPCLTPTVIGARIVNPEGTRR